MLVISRKVAESILIGDDIEIVVSDVGNDKVKLCIKAPKEIPILRRELLETKQLNEEANTVPDQAFLQRLKSMAKTKHDAEKVEKNDE